MPGRRRTVLYVLAAAALLAAGVAASALAASIHGTAHADVIHGTPKADVIHGLAGNDKIYGGAGNDKLYGGAGNDKLYGGSGSDLLDCGPGRDTAVADRHDKTVGCEIVKRTGGGTAPPPPPPTTTTAPPPPTTTTTPTANVQQGTYCGYTNNGGGICFDVAGAPVAFTNAKFDVTFDGNDCSPPASGRVQFTISGAVPLGPDGSFDFEATTGNAAGSYVKGTVDSVGSAQGDMHLAVVLASGGTTFTCQLNASWTAKKQ